MNNNAGSSKSVQTMQHDVASSPTSTSDAVDMTKTTYAVGTGLYDALPADIRLGVYKAAFPEMVRLKRYDRYSSLSGSYVKIIPLSLCFARSNKAYADPAMRNEEDDHCTCFGCAQRRRDRLRNAIKSPFARDPTIRHEFLSHYLSLVQVVWDHVYSEKSGRCLKQLPEFLELMHSAGVVSNLRHLSIG